MASSVLVGAGATALTGTLLLADPLGAEEGSKAPGAVAPANPGTALAEAAQRTVTAGAAGTVAIQRTGDLLKVVGVAPNEGWTPVVKRPVGETVKVGFVSADGARVHVRGHLTDEGLFRYSVREKGRFDVAAFQQAKATFFQALAEKQAAEKAAADRAAAERAAAAKAAEVEAARAAQADDGKDGKDHDGWCDKDGDFDGARAERHGDDDDWDDQDWKDHDDGGFSRAGHGDWGRHR